MWRLRKLPEERQRQQLKERPSETTMAREREWATIVVLWLLPGSVGATIVSIYLIELSQDLHRSISELVFERVHEIEDDEVQHELDGDGIEEAA